MTVTVNPSASNQGAQALVTMQPATGIQLSSQYFLRNGSSVSPNASGQIVVPWSEVSGLQNAGMVVVGAGNT